MSTTWATRKVRRALACLGGAAATALLLASPAVAVGGDDYPAQWGNPPQDTLYDSWGYRNRECTSFVAWRLHSVNEFEMPYGIGNAGTWGSWFEDHGYRVDNTPAVGAIAESSTHVAWVRSVGNGTVTVEDYNNGNGGRYDVHTDPTASYHYIHAKDIPPPARGHADFNGNGKSDIFWYGPGSGSDTMWFGTNRNDTFATGYGVDVTGEYTPVSGDFDGDGYADVLWYGPGAANDRIWYGTPVKGAFDQSEDLDISGTYTPIAADFNGNGKSDVLWYGPGAANDRVWYGSGDRDLDGVGFETSYDVSVNGIYTPLDGDFDDDGFADVLWYGPGSAADRIWFGTGTKGSFANTDNSQTVSVNGTYSPFTGDFDGDGNSDVFWYGPGTASDTMWFGANRNATFGTGYTISINGTYTPVAGNFDGDEQSDVVWYAPGTSGDRIWYGTSTRTTFANTDNSQTVSIDGVYVPIS